MIVLDTNVVSEMMLRLPNEHVASWLDAQPPASLFLTSITAAELLAGVGKLLPSPKKHDLSERIEIMLARVFHGRIFDFDLRAAQAFGDLAGPLLRARTQFDATDLQIAAIAVANGSKVATRNVRHFGAFGIDLVDPWTA